MWLSQSFFELIAFAIALLTLEGSAGADVEGATAAATRQNGDEPSSTAQRASVRRMPICYCGEGQDYGCDQTGCGSGDASCKAGHCTQDGLEFPTCDGGSCSQLNATSPTCDGGNCDQENAMDPTCLNGDCCPPKGYCKVGPILETECIGAETQVFSCTRKKFLPAQEVATGESIRCVTVHGPVCSDVYYAYRHKAEGLAYVVTVRSQSLTTKTIILSPKHIVYIGRKFTKRRATWAKDLRVGDALVSSNGSSSKEVLSIETRVSKLVNILTFEPAIDTEAGVVISAHSYDDVIYPYIFWPFALAYKYLGVDVMATAKPLVEMLHNIATSAC